MCDPRRSGKPAVSGHVRGQYRREFPGLGRDVLPPQSTLAQRPVQDTLPPLSDWPATTAGAIRACRASVAAGEQSSGLVMKQQ
jgi:hypothetical protein